MTLLPWLVQLYGWFSDALLSNTPAPKKFSASGRRVDPPDVIPVPRRALTTEAPLVEPLAVEAEDAGTDGDDVTGDDS